MHQTNASYYPGLEFYRIAGGITGIENNKEGTQHVYTSLTDDEVSAWTAAWLRGERWSRTYQMQPELLESV